MANGVISFHPKDKILRAVKRELESLVEPVYREVSKGFFKEWVEILGVRTPKVRKIAQRSFRDIQHLEKKVIFTLIEKLLKTRVNEYQTVAFHWLFLSRKMYASQDGNVFERWLQKYVRNWGSCDDFCTHALGYFLLKYEEFLPRLEIWARSPNRWERRASSVALIYGLRRRQFLKESFSIANILLKDEDDLVQKGYGWMLKEASHEFPKEIFAYVMKNKSQMTRTALRYAIENMPEKLRKQAMK